MELKDIIEKLRDPEENFPLILDANKLTPARLERYVDSLQRNAEYLEAGAIPNARHKEQAETLNRLADGAFEESLSKPFAWSANFKFDPDVRELYNSMNSMSLTQIGSSMKKLSKFMNSRPELSEDPFIKAAVAVFSELNVIVQTGDALKGMVQKRVVKSEKDREAEAKYIPPVADKAAFALVHKTLIEITDDLYRGLVEARISQNTTKLDRAIFKSENGARYSEYDHQERQMLSLAAQSADGVSRDRQKYVKKPNAEALIEKASIREADDIRDSFVLKNLQKLASIIDKKNNMESIEIVGRSVDLNGMEGTLKINFKDDSSFKVTNQVVLSESVLGKAFYRFPLIFREVKLPSGEMQARPSEEWMNMSF